MIQEFFSASAQSTLRYQIIDGEGPLLIMIHGLGCTGLLDYSQAALMPALQGRKIALIDLLGAGESEKPLNFAYTVEAHAQVVSELIQSRFVLEEVVQGMGLDLTYEQMKGKVSVTTPTDTRILAITVKDKDPVMAMKMANAIREAASVHIMNVMDIQAVNVAETANMPMKKASPSVLKNTFLGGVLGVFLIIAVVLVRYLMDDTIKTPEDVEKYLQLSTLAVIPLNEGEADGKKKKKKVKRS